MSSICEPLDMHAQQLISLANTYAHMAALQRVHRQPSPREASQSYWLTNRFRHEYWSGRLAAHRAAIQGIAIGQRHARWLDIVPVIEEILLSEPLTRVVALHGKIMEREQIDDELAPLAHSVLTAHLEARHRCLHLIVFGSGLSPALAVRLNRLRRNVELFNDQLMASLPTLAGGDLYSFDQPASDRARDELASTHLDSNPVGRRVHERALFHWSLQNTSLDADPRAANGRLNQRLSETVLEMWPQASFDGLGVARSPRGLWPCVDSSESDGAGESSPSTASPLSVLQPNGLQPNKLQPSAEPRRDVPAAADRRW